MHNLFMTAKVDLSTACSLNSHFLKAVWFTRRLFYFLALR